MNSTKRKEKKRTYTLQNGEKLVKHFYYTDEFELVQKVQAFEHELAESQKFYFRRVAEEWMDEHFSEVSGGTQISYTPAYHRAVEYLGDRELKDIAPLDIKRILDRMAKERYSAQTVRVQRIVLNLIFKFAVLNAYTDFNPVSAVSVPRNLPKSVREIPSDEEIRKVMCGDELPFGMFAYLLLFTGCRRGEALALQWSDIDFDKNTIHIHKSVNYSGDNQNIPIVSPHPKSDAGIRHIIMLDCLRNRLLSMKADAVPEEYLFGGVSPLTKTVFRKRWTRYTEEAGIDITPHQLRHAYATMLYDAGIDEKMAQDLMGHSSIQLTRNIYTHIRKDRKELAAEELNQFVQTQYADKRRRG